MTLVFTLSEFQQVKLFVCLSVANKLRISDAETQSADTLQ